MRGRKPKPLTTHIVEGDPSKFGKRKLSSRHAGEPKVTRGLPLCPRHLNGRARAAWNLWREELQDMKLDARPDAMMLEGACVHYQRAVAADILISKAGILLEVPIFSKEGDEIGTRLKSHPAIATSNSAWQQVRAFCSEFGLSPVSRTRLAIDKGDSDEEDLMAVLSRPREARKAAVQ